LIAYECPACQHVTSVLLYPEKRKRAALSAPRHRTRVKTH
jgi:hypothetical protein